MNQCGIANEMETPARCGVDLLGKDEEGCPQGQEKEGAGGTIETACKVRTYSPQGNCDADCLRAVSVVCVQPLKPDEVGCGTISSTDGRTLLRPEQDQESPSANQQGSGFAGRQLTPFQPFSDDSRNEVLSEVDTLQQESVRVEDGACSQADKLDGKSYDAISRAPQCASSGKACIVFAAQPPTPSDQHANPCLYSVSRGTLRCRVYPRARPGDDSNCSQLVQSSAGSSLPACKQDRIPFQNPHHFKICASSAATSEASSENWTNPPGEPRAGRDAAELDYHNSQSRHVFVEAGNAEEAEAARESRRGSCPLAPFSAPEDKS